MKKTNLKKMALMGITGGVALMTQFATAADTTYYNTGRSYYTSSEMDEGSLDPDAQRESSGYNGSYQGRGSCASTSGYNDTYQPYDQRGASCSSYNGSYQPQTNTTNSMRNQGKYNQPSTQTQTPNPVQNPSGSRESPNYYEPTSQQDNAAKRADLNGR
jgi:hypothetical protein